MAFIASLVALTPPSALAVEPTASHVIRSESNFIEMCSGVELPYQFESQKLDDAILSCMLDHVITAPALGFGFNEPPVSCWPPAYDNIQAVCHDSLAKPTYAHCTTESFLDVINDEVMFMSFSMSMSMSMNIGSDNQGDDDEMMLQERFCSILEGLTTDVGLQCLEMVCDSPSTMPSGAPSEESSAMPSVAPSASPSAVPSASPSAVPSESPSASPTLVVSNPEQVQSSAALVSVVASLAVVAISFLALY